jgi:hypothetical protein
MFLKFEEAELVFGIVDKAPIMKLVKNPNCSNYGDAF